MKEILSYWWLALQVAASGCWSWLWSNVLLGALVAAAIGLTTFCAGPWLGSKFPALKPHMGAPMDSFENFVASAIGPIIMLLLCSLAVFMFYLAVVTPPAIHSEQLVSLQSAQVKLDTANETIAQQKSLIESNKPSLVGKIALTTTVTRDDHQPGDSKTYELILLTIVNRGAPSSVDRVVVNMVLPNGKQIPARKIIVADNDPMIVQHNKGEIQRRIGPSELIYGKLTAPIPQGGQVSGWIIAGVNDATREELEAEGTRTLVQFYDTFDRRYVAESVLGAPDGFQMQDENFILEGEL